MAPYRGVLPESAIRNMEEQLSGACTVEIAAFNEFTAVLAAPAGHQRSLTTSCSTPRRPVIRCGC